MSAAIENMSLYIPHVFPNFTKEDVTKAFEDNCIGKVKNIDFVAKITYKEGVAKLYNAAYIHFEEWYDNIVARNFHSRVRDPIKEARLMYEDPWYWVVLENKARKYIPGERKPCIVLDSTPVAKVQIETKSTWAPVKSLVQQKSVTKLVAVKLDSEFAATQASIEEEEYDLEEEDDIEEEYDLKGYDIEKEEEEKQMDEIEEAIKEDDKYLVSIDSRYIRALEEENEAYRRRQTYKEEATYYYDQYMITNELYKNETIKTKSLMEAFQMMTKEKQV